ncbi:MAG: four-helix bundle copper-binding protein [Nitrospirae bacterium]|nr:four-helix bundle copper-binding protein [Nitrospirota bacterium]MBF0540137.1 four-helix bundle copper-binding protein [Nitrospirota bacterium]
METDIKGITRREVLAGAGVAAFAAMTKGIAEAVEKGHEHMASTNSNAEVIKTANECVTAGQACIAHCIEMFKAGDTSMGECNESTQVAGKMCGTLAFLALTNSKHLKDLAKICIETCSECEAACKKHEKTIAQCASCAKACRNCIEACKKLAA